MLNKKYVKPECVFICDGNEYECYMNDVVIDENDLSDNDMSDD